MSARLLRRHGGLLALAVYEAAAYSRTCTRRFMIWWRVRSADLPLKIMFRLWCVSVDCGRVRIACSHHTSYYHTSYNARRTRVTATPRSAMPCACNARWPLPRVPVRLDEFRLLVCPHVRRARRIPPQRKAPPPDPLPRRRVRRRVGLEKEHMHSPSNPLPRLLCIGRPPHEELGTLAIDHARDKAARRRDGHAPHRARVCVECGALARVDVFEERPDLDRPVVASAAHQHRATEGEALH